MRNYISKKIFGLDYDELPLASEIYVDLTCRKMFYKSAFYISIAFLFASLCTLSLYIAR